MPTDLSQLTDEQLDALAKSRGISTAPATPKTDLSSLSDAQLDALAKSRGISTGASATTPSRAPVTPVQAPAKPSAADVAPDMSKPHPQPTGHTKYYNRLGQLAYITDKNGNGIDVATYRQQIGLPPEQPNHGAPASPLHAVKAAPQVPLLGKGSLPQKQAGSYNGLPVLPAGTPIPLKSARAMGGENGNTNTRRNNPNLGGKLPFDEVLDDTYDTAKHDVATDALMGLPLMGAAMARGVEGLTTPQGRQEAGRGLKAIGQYAIDRTATSVNQAASDVAQSQTRGATQKIIPVPKARAERMATVEGAGSKFLIDNLGGADAPLGTLAQVADLYQGGHISEGDALLRKLPKITLDWIADNPIPALTMIAGDSLRLGASATRGTAANLAEGAGVVANAHPNPKLAAIAQKLSERARALSQSSALDTLAGNANRPGPKGTPLGNLARRQFGTPHQGAEQTLKALDTASSVPVPPTAQGTPPVPAQPQSPVHDAARTLVAAHPDVTPQTIAAVTKAPLDVAERVLQEVKAEKAPAPAPPIETPPTENTNLVTKTEPPSMDGGSVDSQSAINQPDGIKEPWQMTGSEWTAPKPNKVFTFNRGTKNSPVDVFMNPTSSQVSEMKWRFQDKYPEARPSEVKIRQTIDDQGNKYEWMSGDGSHYDIETRLKDEHGIIADQNTKHSQVVYDAVKAGKPVPENVLKDYPEAQRLKAYLDEQKPPITTQQAMPRTEPVRTTSDTAAPKPSAPAEAPQITPTGTATVQAPKEPAPKSPASDRVANLNMTRRAATDAERDMYVQAAQEVNLDEHPHRTRQQIQDAAKALNLTVPDVLKHLDMMKENKAGLFPAGVDTADYWTALRSLDKQLTRHMEELQGKYNVDPTPENLKALEDVRKDFHAVVKHESAVAFKSGQTNSAGNIQVDPYEAAKSGDLFKNQPSPFAKSRSGTRAKTVTKAADISDPDFGKNAKNFTKEDALSAQALLKERLSKSKDLSECGV